MFNSGDAAPNDRARRLLVAISSVIAQLPNRLTISGHTDGSPSGSRYASNFELSAARAHIAQDDLGPAFKMIARVSRIQTQLIQSWDVLATMTPSDYALIRPHLGQSSGFQSHQYRMLEFLMGAKDPEMLRVHEGTPAHATLLTELTPYRVSQGTLRFPLDRPLPIDLIRRVVTALALARRKT